MKLVLINRYFQPEGLMVGRLALELVEYLAVKGVDVTLVTIESENGSSIAEELRQHFTARDIDNVNVISIQSGYSGKNGLLRYFGRVLEGYRLIKRSRQLAADVHIVMTSPQLVSMWGSILLAKKYYWILWSMDLYPEIYIAHSNIKKNNFLYKAAHYFTYKNPPDKVIALGEQQKQYLDSKYDTDLDCILLPAGIYDARGLGENEASEVEAIKSDRIAFAYCGKLGQQNSIDFLLALARNIDPSTAVLIVAIYGPSADRTLNLLEKYEGVVKLDYLPQHEFNHIDVHVSSLNENCTHLCVPSKTVTAVCSGNAFIFCGDEASDNWRLFESAGWRISPDKIDEQVEEFFEKFTKEQLESKSAFATRFCEELLEMRQIAFEEIISTVQDVSARPN